MILGKCPTTHGIVSFNISTYMGFQSNQPLLAGGSTSGIKQKNHIWLFHVNTVVIVKQQDGDKK
jgi:hypothetical protein